MRDCLNENFPEGWILRDGPIGWSANSPDRPAIFSCEVLWRAYHTNLHTQNEPREK